MVMSHCPCLLLCGKGIFVSNSLLTPSLLIAAKEIIHKKCKLFCKKDFAIEKKNCAKLLQKRFHFIDNNIALCPQILSKIEK